MVGLREAEEGTRVGIPKGAGAGRNRKTFRSIAQYFAIGKVHTGGNH